MTQSEFSFSTRRRVILIQVMYALIMNCENLNDFTVEDILQIICDASLVSRHKQGAALDSNSPDVATLLGLLEELATIDSLITQHCNTSSRLPKVVLAILRVAVYELKYFPEKHKIGNIIKDYLNIAVAFGHSLEAGFINGVLDKIYSLTGR